MSRTYRKIKWYEEHSDVSFINREFALKTRFPFQLVKVQKTQEEYEYDLALAEQEYQQKLKDNGGKEFYIIWDPWFKEYHNIKIRKYHVRKFKHIKIPLTDIEIKQNAVDQRARMQRDGYWNETTPKTGFKRDAAKTIRRKNKQFCKKVLKGDWENDSYPIRKEAKYLMWKWF